MTNIEDLKRIDLSRNSLNEIKGIVCQLKIPCIQSVIPQGICILRGRYGSNYYKRSQFTYCPKDKCTKIQRASLPNFPVYYGVISDDMRHLEKARAIVSSECSPLFRQGIHSSGKEVFSISKWTTKKNLTVISFITDRTFPNIMNNNILNEIREKFVELKESGITQEELECAYFISEEFSKTNNESNELQYQISATIATEVLNKTKCDGIIYPSVPLGGQGGINIVLTKHAVDNKLRFENDTYEQVAYKKGKKYVILAKKRRTKGQIINLKQMADEDIAKELGIKDIRDLSNIN